MYIYILLFLFIKALLLKVILYIKSIYIIIIITTLFIENIYNISQ